MFFNPVPKVQMTHFSANINKIALLRNTRTSGIPSVIQAAEICMKAGAHGITVHPRPDQRHIRSEDVYALADMVRVEFNIEGNPFVGHYMKIINKVRPTQCTLVPDAPRAFTSNQGWDIQRNKKRLSAVIAEMKAAGSRVSLFMDPDSQEFDAAKEVGAERVELYTEAYARAYGTSQEERVWKLYAQAAQRAQDAGLGVNAGHDLNLENLGQFLRIPGILEVSIGHALIADAIIMGMANAVKAYLKILKDAAPKRVKSRPV
jgi:pyridoxine 5-phosphate synthase